MLSDATLFILLIPAFLGGFLGQRIKIPGGALLFSLIFVAFASNFWDLPHTPPPELLLFLQLLIGCMLGQSISRRFWQDFLEIWRPTVMVVLIFTLAAVPFSVFLVSFYAFDPVTAVLGATPARMQDMIILASSLDSDAVTVMLMQLVRQFGVIAITPFLLARYATRKTKGTQANPGAKPGRHFMPDLAAACRTSLPNMGILFIPGFVGAFLGHLTGHVLGALIGSFCAVAASRLIWLRAGEAPFPKIFAFLSQAVTGLVLGVRITPDTGTLMLERIVPLVSAVVYVLGAAMVIGYLLHTRYGWNKSLAWMAAAPGRAGDLLAISQDIELTGKERLALASVHTVRQVYFTLLVSIAITFLHP